MTHSIFSLGKYMKKAAVTTLIFGLLISPSLALNSSFSSGSSQSFSITAQAAAEGDWLAVADTSWYDSVIQNNADATEFTISNAKQLAGLAKLVNNGTDNFEGKTILLTNDIDLGDHYWIPIGKSMNSFNGIFNGKGHTINNICIYQDNNYKYDAVGLFGVVVEGTIEGVIIGEGSSIRSSVSAGGICGFASTSTTIKYCINKAEIICENDVVFAYAGGIVGELLSYSAGVEIINCINYGSIRSNGPSEPLSRTAAGGIVGLSRIGSKDGIDTKIINCVNNGEIFSNDCAGGICGYVKIENNKYKNAPLTISNSINNGNVSAKEDADAIVGYNIDCTITLDNVYYKKGCVTQESLKYNSAIRNESIKNALSKRAAVKRAAKIIQAIEENLAAAANEAANAVENTTANVENNYTGWTSDGTNYYYIENGAAVTDAWRLDGTGDKYYLGSDGKMLNSIKYDSSRQLYKNADGTNTNGLVQLGSYYYYFSNGIMIVSAYITDNNTGTIYTVDNYGRLIQISNSN